MKSKSLLLLLFSVIVFTSFFYYPKYKKYGSEAVISWDVSGYYWYLPAIFIYKDIKYLKFSDTIMAQYAPSSSAYQYFKHRSGYNIMKYSCGQALQYLPFFALGHLAAKMSNYPADGFSLPYQLAIQLGSLLMCFIGLWYLRLILLKYFSDKVAGFSLIGLVLATNYLNFTALDGAMSHNWLFTWYCILIYFSIKYYESPTTKRAVSIGFIVGLCTLTRPTEVISIIIPLLWTMKGLTLEDIKDRIGFHWQHKNKLFWAGCAMFATVFIQLAYYRYTGGEWLIYTYKDQQFSWGHPHFKDYLFNFKAGWFIYTPYMLLIFPGLYFLIKDKFKSWPAILTFALISIYIVSCWDIWWYGGRAMVQSYPILILAIAYFIQKIIHSANRYASISRYAMLVCVGACIYYNVWWTHQVHLGGMVDAYNMNGTYLKKIIGRWEINEDVKKLYDTDEIFEGARKNVHVIYKNDFNADSALIVADKKYGGSIAEFVNSEKQFSKKYEIPLSHQQSTWIRISANYWGEKKEWESWFMTQMIVSFRNEETLVKNAIFRPHRLMLDGVARSMYFDVKLPVDYFTKVDVVFWNAGGTKELLIEDLTVETFDE